MLTNFSDRPYDVDVWGRTSDPMCRVYSAHIFAALLEAEIGPPDRVISCFVAAENEERAGNIPSSDPELARDADTWRRASSYAGMIATKLMDSSSKAVCVLKLK